MPETWGFLEENDFTEENDMTWYKLVHCTREKSDFILTGALHTKCVPFQTVVQVNFKSGLEGF